MIEELAVVVKMDGHQVWVSSCPQSACAGCQQKTACTTQALSDSFKKKPVLIMSDLQLEIGDTVLLAIDEKHVLRAAFAMYLLPLLALLVGAGIAQALLDNSQAADLWVAVGAGCGFLVSLWAIAIVHKQKPGSPYPAAPVIIKKLNPELP